MNNMACERWLPIKGYEDFYHISNLGRVKSLPRKIETRPGVIALFKGKILSMTGKRNYLRVTLSKNGTQNVKTIHRLVAETFIPNINNKKCVNHIDGDKHNNNVSNLEWCTYKENTHHAIMIGTHIVCKYNK